jgi:L-arabinokinase
MMRVRTIDEVRAEGDLAWFAPALERLREPRGDDAVSAFLDPDRPVMIARAPGRLDVMGGIADYSGSLVLEMPLACATFAVAQPQEARRLDILSLRGGKPFAYGIDLDVAHRLASPAIATLAGWFAERPDDRWAAYVVGAVYRCLTMPGVTRPAHGLRLLILSDVPEGKGVSSSAALEVATMTAAAACYGVRMSGSELAAACQWAENHIAGAPCGIMDQMTSALGERDRLLRLLCQPAIVEGQIQIPGGYRFYGIDSGIRHAVTGADYGTVRTAAFMGYRMIADFAGLPTAVDGGVARVEDERWGGYLANIPPDEFAKYFAGRLPLLMEGGEFLSRYGGITDSVTRVDPRRSYPIRVATSHPVYEHARVRRFAELLVALVGNPAAARAMGELMLESHASYGACGLGSDGTDHLVRLVMDAGPERGLFGAKITGGGSGGTVAVLGTEAAHDSVLEIARRYEQETGREAQVFDGSGPGAEQLGVLWMNKGSES